MNSKAKTSAHVVLGLDKEGKPRAALIHPADLEATTKAAASLGFKIGRADSPQVLKLATQLPDAKVFATGKGLVPLVRNDVFQWLSKGLTLLEAKTGSAAGKADSPSPAAAKAGPTKADAASTSPIASSPKDGNGGNDGATDKDTGKALKPDPRLWDQLMVGSVVIAPERNTKDDGYWPAVVTAISKDRQKLTIRWRDFPKQPPLTVKRRSVALLLDHS